MSYHGHVENGLVILDEAVDLPEGTKVSVLVLTESTQACAGSLYDRLKPFVGKAHGLPPDLAQHHDHYLHGQPKR